MTAPDEQPKLAAARVEAALEADPDLARELEMIEAALDPETRSRFRAALGEELARHARPAAAVLAAFGRTAGD